MTCLGTLGLEHTKKERKNLLENFLHQSQKWLAAKNKFLVFRATAASSDFVNFYKFTYWARFFTTYLIKNYLPKRLILQLSLICICVHFRPTPYLLTCKVLEVYCRSIQIIKGVTFKPLHIAQASYFLPCDILEQFHSENCTFDL